MQVQYTTIQAIDFTSAKTKKRNLDASLDGATPTPAKDRKPPTAVKETTQAELFQFCEGLHKKEAGAVLLSLIPGIASNYQPKSLNKKYPLILSGLFDDDLTLCSNEDLMAHCENVFSSLTVTKEESENCELDTRGQANVKEWFNFRAGRVTASRVKAVCRTPIDKPSPSLIKDICYPSARRFSTAATSWGCSHEKDARDKYIDAMRCNHENFFWQDSGFVINPDYPYMGATPDGVAKCQCCGDILVEIKCPYCARNSTLSDSVSCLANNDGKLSLKRDHAYYYQVQCQLLVCGLEFCDFVVWTSQDFFCERIQINQQFCDDMLSKVVPFVKKALLPEIVGKLFSRTSSVNPVD